MAIKFESGADVIKLFFFVTDKGFNKLKPLVHSSLPRLELVL
jgi:hypothetical protein